MTVAPGLVIQNQSLGVAEESEGFDTVDGILGIGPTVLTEDTTSGGGTVPTVSDNLANQGTIFPESIGIFFAPTTTLEATNGEISFGTEDPSVITSSIAFVPKTGASPANEFWGIDQIITYGSASGTTVQGITSGIVDTGTTLFLLETNAF